MTPKLTPSRPHYGSVFLASVKYIQLIVIDAISEVHVSIAKTNSRKNAPDDFLPQ
jgi:hypothetical protein